MLNCSKHNLKVALAMIKQGDREMSSFAADFGRRAVDAEMDAADAKVFLLGSLNQETLVRLDTYVSTAFPGETLGKETMQERLAHIPYLTMLNFLR